MMIIALLAPIGVLAILLSMERLERWTTGDQRVTTSDSATAPR